MPETKLPIRMILVLCAPIPEATKVQPSWLPFFHRSIGLSSLCVAGRDPVRIIASREWSPFPKTAKKCGFLNIISYFEVLDVLFLRAEGYFCSLDVLYGGLRIG